MARMPREKSESGIYHVMLRGNNKQIIFEDDEDRSRFLITMDEFRDNNYEIYAYCLMDNHIHILIKEKDDTISNVIKRFSASYVYWYNKKYERFGHLFQERFTSDAIDSEAKFLRVLRYIHQNPLNARITNDISQYKWSSYHEYINKPILCDTSFALDLFSANDKKAIDLFVDFNNEKNDDKFMDNDDFIRLTDSEVLEYITQLGIKDISDLQHLDKDKRNSILIELKDISGITLRQLARVTGFSKSLIGKL